MATTIGDPVATTHPPELKELYLLGLAGNANLTNTIVSAVIEAAGCGGSPDGPDLVQAAGKLTRYAMGKLEHSVSLISNDQLDGPSPWARLDAFFDDRAHLMSHPEGDYSPDGNASEIQRAEAELTWAVIELKIQSERVSALHCSYVLKDGSNYRDGIHLDWAGGLGVAAACLTAAGELLQELEQEVGE